MRTPHACRAERVPQHHAHHGLRGVREVQDVGQAAGTLMLLCVFVFILQSVWGSLHARIWFSVCTCDSSAAGGWVSWCWYGGGRRGGTPDKYKPSYSQMQAAAVLLRGTHCRRPALPPSASSPSVSDPCSCWALPPPSRSCSRPTTAGATTPSRVRAGAGQLDGGRKGKRGACRAGASLAAAVGAGPAAYVLGVEGGVWEAQCLPAAGLIAAPH